MATPSVQQTMIRACVIAAAALVSAFAASFACLIFTGAVWALAGLPQGGLMAVSDGLIGMVVLLHLSPVVLGAFILGSFCVGIPTYLVLRRAGRSGPLTLAGAAALLSGLAAAVFLGALGPLAVLPVPLASAVGALIFRIVAEQIPKLPPRRSAPPS